MLRRLLVTVCAVVLIQETNLGSLIFGAECFETCPDDTPSRHCSPTCVSCSCATHAKPDAAKATRLPEPVPSKIEDIAEAAMLIGGLHLPDILHVPKPILA